MENLDKKKNGRKYERVSLYKRFDYHEVLHLRMCVVAIIENLMCFCCNVVFMCICVLVV